MHLTSAAFSAAVADKVQSSGGKKNDWGSQLVYWESFSLDPWEVCSCFLCQRELLNAVASPKSHPL
jgi:hypothetical protein